MEQKENGKVRSKTPRSTTIGSRPEYAELGEFIRKLRESKGLQQKPLSRAMGKPEQFLNKVEAGRQRIDVVEFFDLLKLIDAGDTRLSSEFDSWLRAFDL